jgi:hypothetical protein
VTILCSDSELRKPSSIRFKAWSLKLGEGEGIFWDKAGMARVMKASDVFLILNGTMQTYTEKEANKNRNEV